METNRTKVALVINEFAFNSLTLSFINSAQEVSIKVEEDTSYVKWCRNDAPQLDAATTCLIFQQTEIDHYNGDHKEGMPGAEDKFTAVADPVHEMPKDPATNHWSSPNAHDPSGAENFLAPVIRIHGVTMEGHSVMAHIHDFYPYFYIMAPPDSKKTDARNELINEPALQIELVQMANIYGFNNNEKVPFIKITVALPTLVSIKCASRKGTSSEPEKDPANNIQNFDLYYLINRVVALKVERFPFLGRHRTDISRFIDINMEGRVQFDLFLVLLREYKL
uniref:DNA polymerase delta catalytic subunit n=1 Tax=Tetranychus urticae TaxID=32264 RepID=T1KI32_TETUR